MTADSSVGQHATLEALKALTDAEIGAMITESRKQMLMDLREFGLVTLDNAQIAGIGHDEAGQKIAEARYTARAWRA